jgi:hypothetical protein
VKRQTERLVSTYYWWSTWGLFSCSKINHPWHKIGKY